MLCIKVNSQLFWKMKNCESKDGIQWCPFGKPKYLGDFDFADDIALTI